MLLKQVHSRDDHSRCADAALRAAVFDECLLDCMQLSFAGRDAFNGLDVAILHLSDGHEATVNDLAIDRHCAGAAFAFAAPFLCSSQAELLAQNIQQALHRINVKLSPCAVNYAIDLNLARQDCSRAVFSKAKNITFAKYVGFWTGFSGGGQQRQDCYRNHKPELTIHLWLAHFPATLWCVSGYRFGRSTICEGDL